MRAGTTRHGTYLLLALASALFLGSMLFSLSRVDTQRWRELRTEQVGTWNTGQAQIELERLLLVLERYVRGVPGVSADALRTQFEVFWSRIPVLIERSERQSGYGLPEPERRRLEQMIRKLEQLEPLVTGLGPGQSPAYEALVAALQRMRGTFGDLGTVARNERAVAWEATVHGLTKLYSEFLIFFAAMVASQLVIVVLLVREERLARRMLVAADAAHGEARETGQRLQTLIDAVPAMITASDPAGRYLFMNRFHADFYGLDAASTVGRLPSEIGLDAAYEEEVRSIAVSGQPLPFFEQTALDREREEHVLLTTKVPVLLAEGQVGSVVHVSLDITERRAAEERIRHLAHYDLLTELPNRALFKERLAEAIAAASRHDWNLAVHCIDLDRFKEVNDTLGHPIGDALLRAAGERMRGCLREYDTLARCGGDEFAVIQQHLLGPEEAAQVAERIVQCLGVPFILDGHEVQISGSVGVGLAPKDGCSADELLKHADLALYRAKNDGRGRVSFFTPEMNANLLAKRALETDLRRALAEGALSVHFQAKHALDDQRLVGLEALARWQHPVLGSIPPTQFVAIAEETGMIGALGEWVLLAACRQGRQWLDRGLAPPPIAVNLSPAQFAHHSIPDLVERALAETNLPAALLELEITESVLVRSSDQALAVIRRLRAMGVGVSLDDFGTGYSALSYLQRFPFDTLKIDRSFSAELGRNRASRPIIEAIIRLAHGLEMQVVAEGLETEQQVRTLRELGCDAGQGFFFGKPEPAATTEGLLRRQPALARAPAA